ncbi:MAG: hypothetical protein WCG10_02805 [Chlamydiota bacterium]
MLVNQYMDRFKAGDTTLPTSQVLLPIASSLDASMESVVTDLTNVLRTSPDHQARIALLYDQPRTAGSFSRHKILFEEVSAFEQMVAVSDWLGQVHIRQTHTTFLSACSDDYVPMQVRKFKDVDATMMHVMLGTTRGNRKAPAYADWASKDPRIDPNQNVFIRALEDLEVIRQPNFSAATILKSNAFQSNKVDADWRYGSMYACVEDRGQSRNSLKKRQSAALNACAMVNKLSDAADPIAKEVEVCFPVKYEDYVTDEYKDDLEISVTPGLLIEAASRSILHQDQTELTKLMENLAIAQIGPTQTPILSNYIASKLRANAKPI